MIIVKRTEALCLQFFTSCCHIHHTTPHHTTPHHTTHNAPHTTTPHTAPHHTRACTHTCNLVFLEVFIVVVAEELVELAQPNRDLLRAPLLHRKGEAFSGHLSTAADELLKRGRYGRKEVCQGEGGRKMAGQHGTIKKSGGRVDEGGVEVSMAREREEWK